MGLPISEERRMELLADGIVSIPEACEILGLSETTVRSLIDAGSLIRCRLKRRVFVSRRSIAEYMAAGLVVS